jgi:PIN domain
MTGIVLDASALIAMLREEPGAAAVAEALARARMSVVNFAEVVSHFLYTGVPQAELEEMLAAIQISLVDADAELADCAGSRLRPACRWETASALRSAPGTAFRSGPRIGSGERLRTSWAWRSS